MKRILSLAAFIFLALPLSIGPYSSPEAAEIPIGVSFPLTGPLSSIAAPDEKAVELAVEEMNQAGGVKVGGTSYRLKPIIVDNKYSTPGEVGAANRLIHQEKVKITIIWGLAIPHTTISEPAKSLAFSGSPSTKVVGRYTFRICPSVCDTGPVVAKWISENHPEIKTFFTIQKDDVTGRTSAGLWIKSAEYYGFKSLGTEYLPLPTQDFYPVLKRVLALKPDMFNTDQMAQHGLLTKQARELGYKGLFALQWHAFPAYINAAGGACEGVVNTGWDPESELTPQRVKDFFVNYRAKYKMEPSTGCLLFYNATYLAAQAMEKAGTIEDTDRIVKVLETGQFDTPVGKAWFGGKALSKGMPRQITLPVMISKLKGGKFEALGRVEPREVGEGRDRVFGK
jgi:branched-chain amino acid transport system substrate-binding protein